MEGGREIHGTTRASSLCKHAVPAFLCLASIVTAPAHAGFIGHVAAYATGAVIAHEAERGIDRWESRREDARNVPTDAGGVQAEGRYGVVFPIQDARPNARLTPGAIDPRVTQANLRETICRRGGYTKSVRPPEQYTERLKREQIREYGYTDYRLRDYEEDHLEAIGLGGAPSDPRNLWPEPHHVIGGWGSYAKDRLEDRLHRLVCSGRLPLATAQYQIAHDWIAAYTQYVGAAPDNRRPREWGR